MKMISGIVFILMIVGMTDGHRNSIRDEKGDRKELLKDILWHYFWHKDLMDVMKDVGFLCSFTNHKTITANSQIKFDKVLRNDGHGYSAKTGTFTAPVGGLYQFYWSLLTLNSKNIDINLIHEGKIITRGWIHHLSVHDSASNMVYLRVKKGETLFLQTTSSGGKLHNGAYSTFGGELIRY